MDMNKKAQMMYNDDDLIKRLIQASKKAIKPIS